AEERRLHQHHLCIVELEGRLQVRDQDVVQCGQQTPHEEHGGDDAERHRVVGVVPAPARCGRGLQWCGEGHAVPLWVGACAQALGGGQLLPRTTSCTGTTVRCGCACGSRRRCSSS